MSEEQFTCSLCGGQESKRTFQAFDFDLSEAPFDIIQCVQCGLAQTFPVPDQETLDHYYSVSYYGNAAKKFTGVIESLTVWGNRLRANKILRVMSGTRMSKSRFRVLDIGCGRGNLLQRFRKMGCECHGIEREVFPEGGDTDGLHIHRDSLADIIFEDSHFDAVVIWHVLEHLDEPFETLDVVSRITCEGGIAAIAVPNFSSLQSRWFKSDWFHLDLPRHLFHFNVTNLSRALRERGYVIESVSTCSLEQNIFGFVQSLMNALNILDRNNDFYQLLKKRKGFGSSMRLVFWMLIALLTLPFAMLEFVLTCLLGNGASILLFARKASSSSHERD
jgi:SAM-dependent methyltransferase